MTTEKSRADALTDAVWRLKRDLERGDMGAGICLVYMADLRTLLATSPVEQPAAAPSGYCERVGGCVCGGDLPRVREGCSEWVKSKPAASPADEWAAFEAWARGKGSYTAKELEVFNGQYVDEHANTALDAWLAARAASASETVPKWVFDNLVNTLQPAWDYIQTHQEKFNARAGDDKNAILVEFFLRAASANETVAEGAAYRDGIEAVAKMIDEKAVDYAVEFGYWERDTGALSFGQGAHADVKRDYHSSLVELAEEVRAMAAAVPQPAQTDARVGLTDGRIARLRAAIEGECDGLHVDYHHAKAILAYLDDDRA